MLKVKLKTNIKNVMAFLLFGFTLLLPIYGVVNAQTVARGYNTDQNLSRGMIVMLDSENSEKVKALSPDSVDQMHGVVINANESPVTINTKDQKVFVANSGQFSVLVSDQNGEVQQGEFLTISSVEGIGMKAGSSQPLVLGKALEAFNGKDNVAGQLKTKDEGGQEKTVNFGRIKVDISITRNPLLKTEAQVPELLKKASTAVAQKQVNANRIYIGVVALILTSIVAGIVLYAGVRSSIIALGRNPFSRKTILRGLLQVIFTSLIIFLCGLFGVYLLLRI